ncbi:tetratricopeptide repeat-containing response regulator [Hahella ganghwensis]|uniref:tetratricopeptide repeat-containing response regulator n=1 Tax=Hahella ganghwensis TaxID=286420 RepID=UPI00037F6BF4|nr:tetratricopeptide repeat-containing response regulator [Hahella ganghwensis]
MSKLFKTYQKKKFLIVDDFDNFIFSMKQMLRRLGAENIESARNGREAIQRCIANHYDIVFCDYNMGDNKNGQQVLEELRYRKLLKNTDIFFLVSAETAKEMVMGALEYQPDGYITKPITQSLLENRLDRLVDQKETLQDVYRAMDQEDFTKAISLCNQHLKNNSKYRSLILKLQASLFFISGDYAHAKKLYEDIIAKRPLDWARLGLGKVLVQEGNPKEACEVFEYLIQEQPELTEAYDWLAKAQKQLGKNQQAQTTLESAVSISPRALLRQKELAQISHTNHDLATAAKAYRHSSKLSENSCYETPELHLDYVRCLSDYSQGDNSPEGQKLADEASRALTKIREKYKDEKQVQLQSRLVEARVLAGQNKDSDSKKILQTAQKLYETMEETTPELTLEMAETLYALDDSDQAGSLLRKLAEEHPENAQLLHRIEELQDEPVSLKQRIKAREFNREGIQHYEKGDFGSALEAFKNAMEITPLHVGLNLNLLQTIIKLHSRKPSQDPEISRLLKMCFDRLSALTPDHRQYRRYQHLLERYKANS